MSFATSTGGATQPEQDSLETKVAKAAEQKKAPIWFEVLRMATGQPASLSSLNPKKFVALYIGGGARSLRDLLLPRQVGRFARKSSKACFFLAKKAAIFAFSDQISASVRL